MTYNILLTYYRGAAAPENVDVRSKQMPWSIRNYHFTLIINQEGELVKPKMSLQLIKINGRNLFRIV